MKTNKSFFIFVGMLMAVGQGVAMEKCLSPRSLLTEALKKHEGKLPALQELKLSDKSRTYSSAPQTPTTKKSHKRQRSYSEPIAIPTTPEYNSPPKDVGFINRHYDYNDEGAWYSLQKKLLYNNDAKYTQEEYSLMVKLIQNINTAQVEREGNWNSLLPLEQAYLMIINGHKDENDAIIKYKKGRTLESYCVILSANSAE